MFVSGYAISEGGVSALDADMDSAVGVSFAVNSPDLLAQIRFAVAATMAITTTGQMVYQGRMAASAAVAFTTAADLEAKITFAAAPTAIVFSGFLFGGFTDGAGSEPLPIPRAVPTLRQLWTREPLQTIGLIDANDQLIEAELSGRTFYLGLSWNEDAQRWTMSLRDLNRRVLVSGVAVLPLYPLLRQTRTPDYPSGELIVAVGSLRKQELHRSSFKDGDATLLYVEPEDLADAAL